MYNTEWALITLCFFNWERSQVVGCDEQNNLIEGGQESKSKTSLARMASSVYRHPLHLWPLCARSISKCSHETEPCSRCCLGPSQHNLDALPPLELSCPISEPDHLCAGATKKLACS